MVLSEKSPGSHAPEKEVAKEKALVRGRQPDEEHACGQGDEARPQQGTGKIALQFGPEVHFGAQGFSRLTWANTIGHGHLQIINPREFSPAP